MLPRVEFKNFELYMESGKLVPTITEKDLRRGVVISTVVKTIQKPFYDLTNPEMSGLMPPRDTTFLIVACDDNGEILEVEICEARYLDPDKNHPPLVPQKSTQYCVTYQVYKGIGAYLPVTCNVPVKENEADLYKMVRKHIHHHHCPYKDFIIISVEPSDPRNGA